MKLASLVFSHPFASRAFKMAPGLMLAGAMIAAGLSRTVVQAAKPSCMGQ
jgi:hypothetical protein